MPRTDPIPQPDAPPAAPNDLHARVHAMWDGVAPGRGRTAVLAGPLAWRLAVLPPEQAAKLRTRAVRAAARYRLRDGLDFPGVSLIAVARREAA